MMTIQRNAKARFEALYGMTGPQTKVPFCTLHPSHKNSINPIIDDGPGKRPAFSYPFNL
jgi:hypothetical protein